jgi:predicted component of type VI protein secretion system
MEAVRHVSEARSLLTQLRSELDRHPGLEEAINRLEMALNVLSAKSSGLL